jgi:peptidylprolyl isomerase
MRTVVKGDLVRIRYTARLEDGEIFERTQDGGAVEIEVGAGNAPAGLENALVGMAEHEKKVAAFGPDEGYGERDERLERTVARSSLPAGYTPLPGEFVAFNTPKGGQLPAKIKRVEDEWVTVDFNHPLAGKSLVYEVEVTGIGEPRGGAEPSSL